MHQKTRPNAISNSIVGVFCTTVIVAGEAQPSEVTEDGVDNAAVQKTLLGVKLFRQLQDGLVLLTTLQPKIELPQIGFYWLKVLDVDIELHLCLFDVRCLLFIDFGHIQNTLDSNS